MFSNFVLNMTGYLKNKLNIIILFIFFSIILYNAIIKIQENFRAPLQYNFGEYNNITLNSIIIIKEKF